MEDLDYDLPPPPVRGGLYNSGFEGPRPRSSFDISDVTDSHSRLPSIHNSSYSALPLDHSGYRNSQTHSPLAKGYYDNPSQTSLTGQQPQDYIPRDIMNEKRALYANAGRSRKKKWFTLGALGLILIVAAIIVAIFFTVVKPHDTKDSKNSSSSSNSNGGNDNSSGNGGKQALVITGGNGSIITMDNGSTFTYVNNFGGSWYADPDEPFSGRAQAQSYTPPLNTSWRWGIDKVYGVNLGGWLNTEPFIAPAIYEPYVNATIPAVDEYTLSQNVANDPNSGGLEKYMENHYSTFITEQDFAEIAGAGLNWIRIPLPYWAIEVYPGEPFLPNVCWKYFLKAIQWARKYGLRIVIDLHAAPGSQNGWNHSGRMGSVGVGNGVMGIANADRTFNYIRAIAEFVSQSEYSDVVPAFNVLNEPLAPTTGNPFLQSFYQESYNIVRNASGIGENKGPMIMFHDGFQPSPVWAGFLGQPDRMAIDTHPYFAFNAQSTAPISSYAPQACAAWGPLVNGSMATVGMTVAGEFSLATNDCGLYVNGVNLGTRYEGTFPGGPTVATGSCEPWDDWESYTEDTKQQLFEFAIASMDALGNWFFWTWKIGNSTVTGTVRAPFWSYQLGLQQGWIPADPRVATGYCNNSSPFEGPLQPFQTGGVGAGEVPASFTTEFPWPPATITNIGSASVLPSYTQTGSPIPSLPPPTITASNPSTTFNAGNGWANAQDTIAAYTPISGCPYLDPWGGVGAPIPTAPCS
ncbi:hypothetical protein Clacol_006260 [Clathrus columnatus]|uniref:glucan 1,3-beta-glucosidase n=1 Tax=Clathrus columnatus TaxID=1419009 RepID=A0AAV5AGJ2_9AGAM|nr:hypothetical protein Clacol_006260 [Clathrus columnatus]